MLPTPKQSGQLYRFYMWHCSAQGLPFCCITIAERELLPHIFTISLTSFEEVRGCYFLWHFLFTIKIGSPV